MTGLNPTLGPTAGGTMVTITGTGFTGVTAVDFGATPAASDDRTVSATSIMAQSPAGTGAVDVTVTTTGGTSADLVRRRVHLRGGAGGHGHQPGVSVRRPVAPR